jgi:hypothetical protein
VTIVLAAPQAPSPQVDVLPGGHLRVTFPRGDRHYERAGDDTPWRSISGLPWPDDFTGATRWLCGQWVRDNLGHLAGSDLDDVPAMVAAGGAAKLDEAADRGTALHAYVEAVILGRTPDFDWIERAGAGPWLAAADAWLADHPPADPLCEIVVFGESCGVKIAGTVDLVSRGATTAAIDLKTRTKRHDRRSKEAAQLGAYAWCLTNGCYISDRGTDRQLERVDRCEVVTFCPDGTYAIHGVETADAIAAHEARMAFVDLGVSRLYQPAVKGEGEAIGDLFARRLEALTDGERSQLAALWSGHGLPRIAELTEDHRCTAHRLFAQVEPWPSVDRDVPLLATAEQCAEVLDRIRALPSDIRDDVAARGAALRSLESGIATVEDLEDWERLAAHGEAAHGERLAAFEVALSPVERSQLAVTLGRPEEQWTSLDCAQAWVLDEAARAEGLTIRHDEERDEGRLVPAATLDGDKRTLLRAARDAAEALGRPRPAAWADVEADVVVWAAVWIDHNTTNNTGETP